MSSKKEDMLLKELSERIKKMNSLDYRPSTYRGMGRTKELIYFAIFIIVPTLILLWGIFG
jgi:hypothetical protein